MGKNGKKVGLGRALVNNRLRQQQSRMAEFNARKEKLNTTEVLSEDRTVTSMKSIIETNDYETFLSRAIVAGKEFTALRGEARLITTSDIKLHASQPSQAANVQHLLRIPWRPSWTKDMTGTQLKAIEEKAFLEWRRGMAIVEENSEVVITPFEKNLNVWRQLWHVVEKSDIIVQVVDARNPLLYRCTDLEKYVKFISKRMYGDMHRKRSMLVVNKADLLTEDQRKMWAKWFDANRVPFIFYSAIDEEDADPQPQYASHDVLHPTQMVELLDAQRPKNQRENEEKEDVTNEEAGEESTPTRPTFTVGLVGFPNVGKSTFINSLFSAKKVATGSTPGKTKHYQTLFLRPDLVLCDCPGLVFPTMSATREEMVVAGVLPIDRMRDYLGPTTLVLGWFPREVLGRHLNCNFPKPTIEEDPNRRMTAHECLGSLATSRGFVSKGEVPDCGRASRILLKEIVTGRLTHCRLPPTEGDIVEVGSESVRTEEV